MIFNGNCCIIEININEEMTIMKNKLSNFVNSPEYLMLSSEERRRKEEELRNAGTTQEADDNN